jgi:hypothetical protein
MSEIIKRHDPIMLTLAGLDGNAFALMGAYARAARQQGVEKAQREAVLADCRSGDYHHLLAVLMTHCAEPGNDGA